MLKNLYRFNLEGMQELITKIKELEKSPKKGKHLKYSNFWRLRVENYRIIYEIEEKEKIIKILYIGHRKNVYDDFSKLF